MEVLATKKWRFYAQTWVVQPVNEGRWGENHLTMAIFLSSSIGASSTHEGLAVARLDSQRIFVIPGCRLLHTSNCLRQDCNRSIQILDFRPAADLPKGFERLWTPSAWPHCRNRLPSICTRLMFPYCYSGFQLEVSEKSWGYPQGPIPIFMGLFHERNQLLGVPGYLPRNKPRNGELHHSADPEDEKARAGKIGRPQRMAIDEAWLINLGGYPLVN